MKKAFSLVEIVLVLLILTTVFFTVIPFSVSNIKQAHFISDWKNYIDQVKDSYEILSEYKKTNTLNKKESVKKLLNYLDAKPLFEEDNFGKYNYRMANERFYKKRGTEEFDEIYKDLDNRLIGVKYSLNNLPYATVWVDINGKNKPNIVGRDIYIYEIYDNSVSPYGRGHKMDYIKNDCSKNGTGMTCSQFFILGGDLK